MQFRSFEKRYSISRVGTLRRKKKVALIQAPDIDVELAFIKQTGSLCEERTDKARWPPTPRRSFRIDWDLLGDYHPE